MKKVLSLILTLVMLLAFVPVVQADEHFVISLNTEWDFKYYPQASDVPEDVTKIVFEDKIQVPGAMEMQGYGYPSYYYEEISGWGMAEDDGVRSAGVYRLSFDSHVDYPCLLCFDNVSGNLTVYINGEKAGESKNGSIGSVISVPVKNGENTLICVVERNSSEINKKDDFAISGIMGNVTLTNGITITNAKVNAEVKDNTLTVDGKEVVLKGVKYTPTHPETGNSITNEQIDKDLKLIKEYGFNAVWVSCAPAYFYTKAEEMGLYVIDEANINLGYADRDMETAKKRIAQMVQKHSYKSVIMWSVGYGSGNSGQLIEEIKKLDSSRPVAQEVNFAPDFEVFGNTGGMEEWVKTLGNGNVGGFVDEFADKELYYIKNAYNFTVDDTATGKKVSLDGEIANYKGVDMLGKGTYTGSVDTLDEFTVLTYISNANKDRVLFETEDKSIRLETINYRIRLTVNGRSIDADGGEGKVAAVYADGEMQLFTSRSFKSNMECDVKLKGGYTVGEGNGAVGIEYVKIYDDVLTIDELVDMSAEDKCISSVEFKDIDIKKDNSYKFLAYGGDFGDEPNSYYKCLTGIFTSTREPHPEANVFQTLLTEVDGGSQWARNPVVNYFDDFVEPVVKGDSVTFTLSSMAYTVDFDGRITSIKNDGKELLTDAMYPTVHRENTLSENEMGVENYEGWRRGKAEVRDNVLYIELISTATEGRLKIAYSLSTGGFRVSMQCEFADTATEPTFLGFRGAGDYDKVYLEGSVISSYPDRRADERYYNSIFRSVAQMSDNYAVPQESGNYEAEVVSLYNEGGNELWFSNVIFDECIQFQVHNYSPEAMEKADHDEDIVHEDKAYFRVGGYIAGVSDDRSYDLTENVYGFDFFIRNDKDNSRPYNEVTQIFTDGKKYNAFTTGVKNYVYRTNNPVSVTADGDAEVIQDDKKAVIGDYTVYFAPATEYLSDMTEKEITAEIALDADFSGNKLNMRGNDYWAPSVSYDKGVVLKDGSATYDVSQFESHTFNAVIGKNDMDWRSMGGGFDRNMFNASSRVTIALDGVVVYEKGDVSMRSGSEEVNIDVSKAKEMTITVTANGQANSYSDAVLANAAFVPDGPIIISFEKKDGKAEIIVLNTDEEYVDVVLSSDEEGVVKTTAARIGKGLYRTVEVSAGEKAKVTAVITGQGTVTIE